TTARPVLTTSKNAQPSTTTTTTSTTISGGEHSISGTAVATGATAMAAGAMMSQRQQKTIVQEAQGQPTVNKVSVTLKLNIIRYERSDAPDAKPTAPPGTLMFSQMEMLDAAREIIIPGSAFSHVRDVSKAKGKNENMP